MINVMDDVWRANCIAAIGNDDDKILQVYPVGTIDCVEYVYETEAEMKTECLRILKQWKAELEKEGL